MIIVIDGPSGTGKSTLAKEVAKKLGFTFFDTGAMYRAFAWKVVKDNVDPSDEAAVNRVAERFGFKIEDSPWGEKTYSVDGEVVTEAIRSREMALLASQVSTYPAVRQTLVKMQRQFAKNTNAVFEGRDMGTVVFPDADLKIFLTADAKVRAERRYQELLMKFPDLSDQLSQEQILHEIEARDQNDRNRAISPLQQAVDAILIDTSHMTIAEVVDKVVRLQAKVPRGFTKMKPFYRFVYRSARLFFRIFFGLRVYGLEHIRSGSGLMIANHTSFFDPPVLAISCPEEVHFLGKESLFQVPFLGWVIRRLNTHPIAKDAGDLGVLKRMVQLLKERKKLIMFPEGQRSLDGTILPFHRGLFFLAEKAKCSIFPAYLDGVFEAWPCDKKWPRLKGKITCVFGSPIRWEEFEHLPKRQAEELLLEKSRKAVENLQIWLKNGAKGSPP